MQLVTTRALEIDRILAEGDAGRRAHPEYQALAAIRRRLQRPIMLAAVQSGDWPTRIVWDRPVSDTEAIIQRVLASALVHLRRGRPVGIAYSTPPEQPPSRVRHAWRVGWRLMCLRS